MTQESSSASLMDKIYKKQRRIYGPTRKHSLLGRDHLIRKLDVPRSGTVLELGCGTGRNLIAAAKAYPSCQLFGVDISEEMLKTAQANINKAGLAHRIYVIQADATNFDPFIAFGIDRFERVFLSYCVSMIPEWEKAIEHGLNLRSAGGQLSLVDFGQQERLPRLFKRMLTAWLCKYHVQARADLEQTLTRFSEECHSKLRFEKLYRGYAYYAQVDGSFYSRFMENPGTPQQAAEIERAMSPVKKAS